MARVLEGSPGVLTEELAAAFDRLWPICRSLAGPGLRESLDILSELMPLKRRRFATGRRVFDWTVPREWIARDAYLLGPDGRHAEFKKNNLHLVNYSAPFRGRLSLQELKPRLHSRPELPEAVPYLTSYYRQDWGFCLSHRELESLPPGEYEVVVDTELKEGHLDLGEAVLPGTGKPEGEVFFSTYLCHPSLANDNLSGPLLMTFLYRRILAMPRRRYTYRFALVPETIGALCFLSLRGRQLKRRMVAGYQITCVGDPGPFTYKRSRRGEGLCDRAAELVLQDMGAHQVIPFDPSDGSDERQYCSPGFDLPMGSLMRTPYGRFPQYHTSLDDKKLISFEALAESLEVYVRIVEALEGNLTWKNTVMYGEPHLGRHGLYRSLGGQLSLGQDVAALFWLLNLADGTQDLLSIARQSRQPLKSLLAWAQRAAQAKLLAQAPHSPH